MEIFINECSLNEQFQAHSLAEAMKIFLTVIKSLNQFNQKKIYKSSLFFNYKSIKDTRIETSLKSNQNLNMVFSQNLKNAISWENSQIHNPASQYKYNNEDFVATSVAEITERKIQDPGIKGVLINFVQSKFQDNIEITVNKDQSVETIVSCAFNETSVHEWLVENGFIDPDSIYNEKIGLPPLDNQTVLVNSDLFEPTKWRNGTYGRKVYKLIGTNQLWVVDASLKHSTSKAHIEVFDESSKKHLGTSLYNKIQLDQNFRKKERSINLQ